MALELTFPDGAAFVAGGTGNVGTGVVRTFARAGLAVTFTYRTAARKATDLERAAGALGGRVQAVSMDMADSASIDAALDAAEEFGGPLRTVACTSGAPVPFNRIADFGVEEIESFLAGDAMAYYRLFHRVIPRLRSNGGGSITVTTTAAVDRVLSYDGISSFSKGAVRALVRQVAAEEAAHGIRCNDVAIGMIADGSPDDLAAFVEAMASPTKERLGALMEELGALIRMGRAGRPEEAGDLFAFLASQQASFITGQRVAIDGGMTL
jgi:NAD(P)-dependent dehydrogenase (short-subunit alcohol dehydrogenase family)